jgi:hypothetical protein
MRQLTPGQSFEGFFIQEALDAEGPVFRFRVKALGAGAAGPPLVLASFRALGGASAIERAEREERCAEALERLRGLRHELLPAVIAAGFSDDTAWIVTEAASDMSLKRRLDLTATSIPLPEIVELGIAVAEALRAARGAGLLHLRLASSRILVSSDARLSCRKVLDVGLVDLFGDAPDAEVDRVYRAPEQVDGGAPDERADVYALGLILYEALVIAPLPGDPSGAQVVPFKVRTSALREEPPLIDDVRPIFPEFFSDLIASMVAQDLSKRPPTLEDAIAELAEMRTALARWFIAYARLVSMSTDTAAKMAQGLAENPGSETTSGVMVHRAIRAGLEGDPPPETGKPFGVEDFEVDGVVLDASGAPEGEQALSDAPLGGAPGVELEVVDVQGERPANAAPSSPTVTSPLEAEAKATPRVPYDHEPPVAPEGAPGDGPAAVGGDREETAEQRSPPALIDGGASERGAAPREREPRPPRSSRRASWALGAAGFLALMASFAIVLALYLGGAMKPWRSDVRTESESPPPSAAPAASERPLDAERRFLAPVAVVILPSAPVAPPAPSVSAPPRVERSDVPRAAPSPPRANTTVPEPVSKPAPASASASASVPAPASAADPELGRVYYRPKRRR